MDEADINQIIDACQRNNGDHRITGLLSFNGTNFFQLLEGKRENVVQIMSRITRDNRHRNIKVLGQRPVYDRAYLSWGFRWDHGQAFTELGDAMRFNGIKY